jgi:AraC-like DNA-binding protein
MPATVQDITSVTAPAAHSEPLALMLRLAELASTVERITQRDGEHRTAVPGLTLLRLSQPCASHALHHPALCLIVQGAKRVMLAEEMYAYDASSYLVVAHDLPVMGQVVQATGQMPYLCVRLDFDPVELAQCALDWAAAAPRRDAAGGNDSRGLFIGSVSAALLDPVQRLVCLLESPQDIAALAPLLVREIIYRLITGPEGWRIAALGQSGSHSRRIAQAIAWLREHSADPLRIESLARAASMSPSSLHHHFKMVTAMSPLQYQKRLRLVEARRLMLGSGLDAATAAHRVGYQSPSQFSREYARMFGAPPARDLRELKERARR